MTAATLRRRLIFAGLALALAVSTVVLMARPAGAHQATLTVSVTCQAEDGSWDAQWSLTNSEAGKLMDVSGEDVTVFAPNPVGYSGTATDSTSHVNSVESVTAHVTVDWVRHEPLTYELTAFRPEACVVPPTTTTTVPPTTTTTAPPPSDTTEPPVLDTQVMVRQPDVYVGELPRTGTGTVPLTAAGFGLVAVGLRLLLVAKSRRLRGDV